MPVPSLRLSCIVGLLCLFGSPAEALQELALEVGRDSRVVFDHRHDRCDAGDIVDTPARAIRRPDGQILLFATHHTARALTGPSFGAMKRDCAVVFKSTGDPNPANHDDRTWLAALWTNDGRNVVALGHQEYQAHRHQGRCEFTQYTKCWFNTVNLLRSMDGGRTFRRETKVPLAAPATRSEDGQGRPRGFFEPSNLVGHGAHVYTLVNTTGFDRQPSGVCLFRADRAATTNWEVLTAEGWKPAGQDPYGDVAMPPCVPQRPLHGPVHSLVRHEPSGTFIAIMTIPGGPERGNLAYSLSDDLLEWTRPSVFLRTTTIFSGRCASDVDAYPSLLDDRSPTPAMDTVGAEATLFLVRQKRGSKECNGTVNRDLIAIPVNIRAKP